MRKAPENSGAFLIMLFFPAQRKRENKKRRKSLRSLCRFFFSALKNKKLLITSTRKNYQLTIQQLSIIQFFFNKFHQFTLRNRNTFYFIVSFCINQVNISDDFDELTIIDFRYDHFIKTF